MANKYEVARILLWQKLPHWKQEAIELAEKEGNLNDHTLESFTKDVIHLAESPDFMSLASVKSTETVKA